MATSDTIGRARYGVAPGIYAIAPSALGLEFLFAPPSVEPYQLDCDGKIAVVNVRGPLCYDPGLFDTYDRVKTRLAEALASPAEKVVLRVSSPGGDVAGALDCSRSLRAMARASGKQLIGFSESQACSSAYALISACDRVVISDTAVVGSIGVISAAVDETAADVAQGKRYTVVTTGARKADGNPHVPVTDDAIAATQRTVDSMGGVFFRLVSTHRPGVSADDAQSLQANVYVGSVAVAKGLADEMSSWDELRASLAASGSTQDSEPKGMPDDDKKDDKDALRASLEKAAASDDPKESARAKRALKAYSAESDAPDDGEDKKDDKDAAAALAAQAQAALVAQLKAVSDQLAATEAERQRLAKADADAKAIAERAQLYAARPDLAEATRKVLDGMALDQVKALLPTLPKAGATNPFAPPETQPTRGDDKAGMRPNAILDAHLAWGETTTAVVQEGTSLYLGKRVPAKVG